MLKCPLLPSLSCVVSFMPPESPLYRITYSQAPPPLKNSEQTVARIVYGAHSRAETSQLHVALPPLGASTLHETWSSTQPIERGKDRGFEYAIFGSLMLAYGVFEETGGLQEATRAVYRDMLHLARAQGRPSILRIWNHFPGICESGGAQNRYQEFCEGRRQALLADEQARGAPLPAVTTTGSQADGLVVYFLSSQDAGAALHNPRQTAPSNYPPHLGPHGPSFCRGVAHEEAGAGRVYLSGTASIVGHETQHVGDAAEQARELLRNHAAVLEQARAALPGCSAQLGTLPFEKIYLMRPEDQEAVQSVLREIFGEALPQYFLHSALCREDLLLEMESAWSA